jgi:hypothetical protein
MVVAPAADEPPAGDEALADWGRFASLHPDS